MLANRREIPAEATESVWVAADGHRIRRIDWQADARRPRGSILFLPGRADPYEKYLETLSGWAAAGWQVTGADWRGQGGSGRLGSDTITGHIEDFALWVADLGALWAEWAAATPGPRVLAGHSMGGHLILRAAAERLVRPDAIVLSAPMLGFNGALPQGMMHAAARAMRRIGDPRRPAWKWSDKPGQPPASRASLLTHDAERYADELWWRSQRPDLVMGPGSWGWVAAAYTSMRALFTPGMLEGIEAPTLILATTNDKLVSYRAIAEAARRMPHCELLPFGAEAHHEILREADPVRRKALGAIEAFLDGIASAR